MTFRKRLFGASEDWAAAFVGLDNDALRQERLDAIIVGLRDLRSIFSTVTGAKATIIGSGEEVSSDQQTAFTALITAAAEAFYTSTVIE